MGSREIGFTIVSMTISLAAVFIPVLFMGGVIGRLLHEFAVTIGAAMLVSGFVSLTLTPMLCSRFLRSPHGQIHGRLYQVSERFFAGMLAAYYGGASTRSWLTARITMLVSGLVLLATGYLFVTIPKGFLPSEDTGQIIGFVEAPQDISFASMVEHQRAVAAIVARDPNVDAFMSSVGAGGSNTANTGRLIISLKPRARAPPQRRPDHPGAPAQAGGRAGRARVPAEPAADPASADRSPRASTSSRFRAPTRLSCTTGRRCWRRSSGRSPDSRTSPATSRSPSPQVMVDIDRDRASALGVTADQIENALFDAYGSRQVSTIYAPTNQYWVIMELLPEYQRDPAALSQPLRRARNATAAGAARRGRARLRPAARPADRHHIWAAAGRDPLVQPARRASRSARP